MSKRRITLNVPAELITNLQELGVTNVTEFLEAFLGEVDAEELLSMVEDDSYWDFDEEVDEEEEDDF